jgi:hypothetical protein
MIRWEKKNKLFSVETSMLLDRPANDPSFPSAATRARVHFGTKSFDNHSERGHLPSQAWAKAARSKLERMTQNMHFPMPAESMSGAVS